MNPVDAVMIIEAGPADDTPETYDLHVAAWQTLYDSGIYRQLQGFYGRTVQALLDEGVIQ